jgi:hypothetical protein
MHVQEFKELKIYRLNFIFLNFDKVNLSGNNKENIIYDPMGCNGLGAVVMA